MQTATARHRGRVSESESSDEISSSGDEHQLITQTIHA